MKPVLALLLVALFKGSLSDKCPFDNGNNCNCVATDPSQPNTFETAECRLSNGVFHPFTSASRFTVTDELAILTDYANITIPANAFSSFVSINRLSFLNSEYTTVIPIAFDPAAFHGIALEKLTFSGFKDVLPLPPAIRYAGQNGLQELVIQNGDATYLAPDQFQGFTKLGTLTIYNVQIISVSDLAFEGLENSLENLTLSGTAIYTYPANALSKLTKLTFLDLSSNNMYAWSANAFSTFTALIELRLRENLLQGAFDSGSFNNFPQSVSYLDLSGGNLRKLSKSMLSKVPNLSALNLATNLISSVNVGDFPDNIILGSLDLSENPINTIAQGAFAPLKSLERLALKQGVMQTVDLALFKGLDALKVLELDFQRVLLFDLVVSDYNSVPQWIERISVTHTGLRKIDPKLEQIVGHQDFMMLDLTRDNSLYCDSGLKWLTKYAVCNGAKQRVNVNGALCANLSGKLLRDYLKTLC